MLHIIFDFVWSLVSAPPHGNKNRALFRDLSFCTGGMADPDAKKDVKNVVARYGGNVSDAIRAETSHLVLDLFTELDKIPSATQLATLSRIAHAARLPIVRESFVWECVLQNTVVCLGKHKVPFKIPTLPTPSIDDGSKKARVRSESQKPKRRSSNLSVATPSASVSVAAAAEPAYPSPISSLRMTASFSSHLLPPLSPSTTSPKSLLPIFSSSAPPAVSVEHDAAIEHRLAWQSLFTSIVTGELVQSEKFRCGKEKKGSGREERMLMTWVELRAYLAGWSVAEEIGCIAEGRSEATEVLKELVRFAIQISVGW
ncbi:hypothetical protein BDK51DRAFT_38151 [Blyttiomyces helicus]|uniref:BRCT domain-containing protein n=1 Tax=Blyttiomyces helicus TaxID=388810 RepID=A0A4P9W5V6_9FUNG|nr:hypothetical protein BDK51DRAFT_38151 [Blyttiomyces helicus]|eukprot:RKO86723.1 hypothetical protein BDK51DRAFT_38151 [Blyttiomyces helicus]